jgi:hypothetical protein
MVSPYSTDIPLVPDTVPSPSSRVQGRTRSRTNGQLLASDGGTDESPKVPEGQLPRETELVRNQITNSDAANGILGILEEYTKYKNRQASAARSSKQMPMFLAIDLRVVPGYFHSPADICDGTLSESALKRCN